MNGGGDIFSGHGVYTMPPSSSFLDALATGLIDATDARNDPEQLANSLVFVPNRRSARELALAFYRALGRSILTPNIRPLGDIDENDGAEMIGEETLNLAPAVSTPRRRGALAMLIQKWRTQQGEPELPPGSTLAAADELTALLDQSVISQDVDWSQLNSLSLENDLAAHWRISADFLNIVSSVWPDWLSEQGAMDPLARRRAAAEALAAKWEASPPDHPIIIAGSTGATAASRRLMRAVATVERGVIVLPGFDPDVEEDGWDAIQQTPSHPQFAFRRTLRALRLLPNDVKTWPGVDETNEQRSRRRLFNESLAPAQSTGGWNQRLEHLAQPDSSEALVKAGLSGVRLIEAEDETQEALVAALLLRETLETPDATAALVTPDHTLGRRVAALMHRWGVDIAPSAGEPLHRTRIGSFLLLLMRWARDPSDPVHLLAVLKHELTTLGMEASHLDQCTSGLERSILRGPRRWRSLGELAAVIRTLHTEKYPPAPKDELEATAQFVEQIADLHAPFAARFEQERLEGEPAAQACAELAASLAVTHESEDGTHIWSGSEGALAAQFLEHLASVCREMGGVDSDFWPEFADTVAQGMTAAPDTAEHPRIAIWGPLEARLQKRDRVILAGLNEGSWPQQPPVDGFLNRALRKKIGFADSDERIGLSAHDFAQLANAGEVILLRAERVEDKPAVASRWVWRLRTLAAGGLGSMEAASAAMASEAERDPIVWARSLREVKKVSPAVPPAPTPPVDARHLNRFSPSRVGRLIRDPYADYASRILGLEKLRPVGDAVAPNEIGTAIHAAIEKWEEASPKPALEDVIVEELVAAGKPAELVELERSMWTKAANRYLEWKASRAARVNDVLLEVESSATFEAASGTVTLKATADRIEKLDDGSLAIIDFKTGAPPTPKNVQSGLEPQLPLEAWIGEGVGFGKLKAAPVSELIFYRFSISKAAFDKKNGDALKLERGFGEAALGGLVDLIKSYSNAGQPYLSKPRVQFASKYGDYDRLARRGEWIVDEDAGDEA